MAEGVGFEPTIRKSGNDFRDRPDSQFPASLHNICHAGLDTASRNLIMYYSSSFGFPIGVGNDAFLSPTYLNLGISTPSFITFSKNIFFGRTHTWLLPNSSLLYRDLYIPFLQGFRYVEQAQ